MKTLKLALLSLLAFAAPVLADDTRTASDIINARPTNNDLARLYYGENIARIRVLATASLDAAVAGSEISAMDAEVIKAYFWIDKEAQTSGKALDYLKKSYPLPTERKREILKFVKTRADYDTAKAAGFVVEGTPLLPDCRAGVLELACVHQDFAFVDTTQRAGALESPLQPKNYMRFLQWKFTQIPTDKLRYDYLQNELTNLMLSDVSNPNDNEFANLINKASDLIYLRLRRAQTLSQEAP